MAFVANATADIDAQSQYKTIITICIVMSTLSLFIVGARLGIRTMHSSTATDDWMSLLSLLFAIAYSALNLITYTRVNYAGRPVYQLGISFFKIALLISYLRLLRGTDRKAYRMAIWLTIVFVSCSHLSTALLLLFSCNPIDKSWNPLKSGTCLPTGASFTAYAAVTITSDVLVTVLPIPILYSLNIRVEKKVGLIGSFTLGLFTTLCSILRYQQINRIQFGDGNSTMLVVWGVIEFHVGTMVSSLPLSAAHMHAPRQRLPFQATGIR
ncbi:hypothetical protein NQ176_g2210 [Zarea fungicola]|uniref:Uncharacterized protein n=1 Tax=Zarea fungicola TaxID=93591 RepID=A0ACC1NQD5_9HYPO|nr:hypothetical protein NQ176_g2210 [Lecanicillium fungicola]